MKDTEDTRPIPKEEEDRKVDPEKKRKHNSTYYQKNKERIKALRNQRYLEDPDYKIALLERARIAQKRRTIERRARLKEQYIMAETPSVYRVLLPDGREIQTEMLTTSQLAIRIQRQPQCVRAWEKMGLLPKAMYRSLQNARLYTFFQVTMICRYYELAILRYGRQKVMNRVSTTGFFERVQNLWKWFPFGVEEFEIDHEPEPED
jgi:hypothetical protein